MEKEKTLFEKMMAGIIPCVKVYEDEVCVCIIDKFPTTLGQCLIFPKKTIEYVFDLDQETYEHIFKIAKKIGKAIDQSLSPQRTCLLVEGFEVPHAHIKLYPVYEQPLKISGGKEISDEEMIDFAEKIKSNL